MPSHPSGGPPPALAPQPTSDGTPANTAAAGPSRQAPTGQPHPQQVQPVVQPVVHAQTSDIVETPFSHPALGGPPPASGEEADEDGEYEEDEDDSTGSSIHDPNTFPMTAAAAMLQQASTAQQQQMPFMSEEQQLEYVMKLSMMPQQATQAVHPTGNVVLATTVPAQDVYQADTVQPQAAQVHAAAAAANAADTQMEDASASASPSTSSSSAEIEEAQSFRHQLFWHPLLYFEQRPIDWDVAAPTLPPYPPQLAAPHVLLWQQHYSPDFAASCLPLMVEFPTVEAGRLAWATFQRTNRDQARMQKTISYMIFLIQRVYRQQAFRQVAPNAFEAFCRYGLPLTTKALLSCPAFSPAGANATQAESDHRFSALKNLFLYLQFTIMVALELIEVVAHEPYVVSLFETIDRILMEEDDRSVSVVIGKWHREFKRSNFDFVQFRAQIESTPNLTSLMQPQPELVKELYHAALQCHDMMRGFKEANRALKEQKAAAAKPQAKLTAGGRARAQMLGDTPGTPKKGRTTAPGFGPGAAPIVISDDEEPIKFVVKRDRENGLQVVGSGIGPHQQQQQPSPPQGDAADAADDEVQEITGHNQQGEEAGNWNNNNSDDTDKSSVQSGHADDGEPETELMNADEAQKLEDMADRSARGSKAAVAAAAVAMTDDGDEEDDSEDSSTSQDADFPPQEANNSFTYYIDLIAASMDHARHALIHSDLIVTFIAMGGMRRYLALLTLMPDAPANQAPAASAAVTPATPTAVSSTSAPPVAPAPAKVSSEYPPILSTAFEKFEAHATHVAPSLVLLRRVVSTFMGIHSLVGTHEMSILVLRQLFELVAPRIQYLTEAQIKAEPVHGLVSLMNMFVVFFEELYFAPPSPVLRGVPKLLLEHFELEFAMRLLRCTFLDKRIIGIKWLTRFTEAPDLLVQAPEKTPLRARYNLAQHRAAASDAWDRPRYSPLYLNGSRLAETLVSHALVEILFGEQIHIQLLKRCRQLMVFLSRTDDVFTAAHIELMWQATRGKHESIVHQIYELFEYITHKLKSKPAVYLYRRIYEVPMSEYDGRFINMIRETTQHLLGDLSSQHLWDHMHNTCSFELMRGLWQGHQAEKKAFLLSGHTLDSRLQTLPGEGVKATTQLEFAPLRLTHSSCVPQLAWDDYLPGQLCPFDAETISEQFIEQVRPSMVEYFGVDLLWKAFNTMGVHDAFYKLNNEVGSPRSAATAASPSSHSSTAASLSAVLRHASFDGLHYNILTPLFKEGRPCCARRMEFIMLSFKNIKLKQNVGHSMKLLRDLAESFAFPHASDVLLAQPNGAATIGSDWDDRPQLVMWLESQKHLSSIVFEELAHFSLLTLKRQAALDQGTMSPDVDAHSLAFWNGPAFQLQRRLEFIAWMFAHFATAHQAAVLNATEAARLEADTTMSVDGKPTVDLTESSPPPLVPIETPPAVVLRFEHIERIFRCFLLVPNLPSEVGDVAYRWLRFITLSNEVLLRVHHELVPLLNFATLTMEGASYLIHIFVAVNAIQRKVDAVVAERTTKFGHHNTRMVALNNAANRTLPHEVQVMAYPLDGEEFLWNGALYAKNSQVSTICVQAVVRMYTYVHPSLRSETNARYEECIARCMKHIHDCTVALRAMSSHSSNEVEMDMSDGSITAPTPRSSSGKSAMEVVADLQRGFALLQLICKVFEGIKPITHEASMRRAATLPTTPKKAGTGAAPRTPGGTPLGDRLRLRCRTSALPDVHLVLPSGSAAREIVTTLMSMLDRKKEYIKNANQIVIIANGQQLADLDKTLEELHIADENIVQYVLREVHWDPDHLKTLEARLQNVINMRNGEQAGKQLASIFTPAKPLASKTKVETMDDDASGFQVHIQEPAEPSAPAAEAKEQESKSQEEAKPEEKSEEKMEDVTPAAAVAAAPAPPAPAEPIHPTQILSRPEYFNQLFDLLSVSIPASAIHASTAAQAATLASVRTSQLAEQCWKLLMQLPTNEQMLQRLKQLSSSVLTPGSKLGGISQQSVIDWNALLASDTIPKLHYSLQIVFAFVSQHRVSSSTTAPPSPALTPVASPADANTQWDASNWERNFVSRGGLRHLVRILVETDFSARAATPVSATPMPGVTPMPGAAPSIATAGPSSQNHQSLECLSLLLRIILRFTQPAALPVVSQLPTITEVEETPALEASATTDAAAPADAAKADDDVAMSDVPADAKKDGAWLQKKRKADSAAPIDSTDMLASARQHKKRAVEPSDHETFQRELQSVFTFPVASKLFLLWQEVSAQPDPVSHPGDIMAALHSLSTNHSAAMASTAAAAAAADDVSIGPKTAAAAALSASFTEGPPGLDVLDDIVHTSLQVLTNILIRPESSDIARDFFLDLNTLRRWSLTILTSSRLASRAQGATRLLAIVDYWSVKRGSSSPLHFLARHVLHLILRDLLSGVYDQLLVALRYQSNHFMEVPRKLIDNLALEFVESIRKYDAMDEAQRAKAITDTSGLDDGGSEAEAQQLRVDGLQLVWNLFRKIGSYAPQEVFGELPFDESFIGYINLLNTTVAHLTPRRPIEPVAEETKNEEKKAESKEDEEAEEEKSDASKMKATSHPPPWFPPNSPLSELIGGLQMVGFLYNRCLFYVPPVATPFDVPLMNISPVCKNDLTRLHTMQLLRQLSVTSRSNFASLQECTMAHMLQSKISMERTLYNLDPATERKRHGNYVGLVNQGATCYMNSLMQQLFMVPEFRYGILAQLSTDKLHDYMDRDDDLMYQMQSIFGHLMDSDKATYDADCFCTAYKDYDGQPMQKGVQQDAQEFASVLFDKLETAIKGSPHANLLDHVFGGKMSNQLIGREASCTHERERLENFYMLSLDVKGKKSVAESLKSFVEGEMLEGDNKFQCIVSGTPVTLADGSSRPIEQVEVGSQVLCLSTSSGSALVSRHVKKVLNRGVRPCIELTFLDGNQLTCTADHRIMCSDGKWREAGQLKAGVSAVSAGIKGPTQLHADVRSSAFARVLGYSMAMTSSAWSFRHIQDVEALSSSIRLVTNEEFSVRKTELGWTVEIPASLWSELLASRTQLSVLLHDESHARAFLAGLFGSAASSFTIENGSFLPMQLKGKATDAPMFTTLLDRAGIDYSVSAQGCVRLSLDASIRFAEEIGFAFACEKQLQATAAVAILRAHELSGRSISELIDTFGARQLFQPKKDSKAFSSFPLFQLPLASVRPVGQQQVWDLTVPGPTEHEDSFVANGIVVHNCGECNRKVDTLKRVCIKTTPNNLILHLKRFEFDMDHMEKIKLNDAFEFPMILDIYDATVEGLAAAAAIASAAKEASGEKKQASVAAGGAASAGAGSAANAMDTSSDAAPAAAAATAAAAVASPVDRSAYQYELTGVIIHHGTAGSGHYYSYALERCPLPHKDHSTCVPQWYCFNDSHVTPFQISTLAEHAFGGQMGEGNFYMKPYSAYILFYQKLGLQHQPHPNRVQPAIPRHLANNAVMQAKHDAVLENRPEHLPTAKEAFEPLAKAAGVELQDPSDKRKEGTTDEDGDTEMTDALPRTVPAAAPSEEKMSDDPSDTAPASSHKRKEIEEAADDDPDNPPLTAVQRHQLERCAAYRTQVATDDVSHLTRCLTQEEQSSLLPSPLFRDIWTENARLNSETYLFDKANLQLVWTHTVISGYDFSGDQSLRRWDPVNPVNDHEATQIHCITLAMRFINYVLLLARHKTCLPTWELDFKRMFVNNVPASRFFLDAISADPDAWMRPHLHHGLPFKKSWMAAIVTAYQAVRPFEKDDYETLINLPLKPQPEKAEVQPAKKQRTGDAGAAAAPPTHNNNDSVPADDAPMSADEAALEAAIVKPLANRPQIHASSCARFLAMLVKYDLGAMIEHWLRATWWYQLMFDLCRLGTEEQYLLLNHYNIISTIAFAILGKDAKVPLNGETLPGLRKPRLKKKSTSTYKPHVQLLGLLLDYGVLEEEPGRLDEQIVLMVDPAVDSISHPALLEVILTPADDADLTPAIQTILRVATYDCAESTKETLKMLLDLFKAQVPPELGITLEYLTPMLHLHDEFRGLRQKMILRAVSENFIDSGPKAHDVQGKCKYPQVAEPLLNWLTAQLKAEREMFAQPGAESPIRDSLFQTEKFLEAMAVLLWCDTPLVRAAAYNCFRELIAETPVEVQVRTGQLKLTREQEENFWVNRLRVQDTLLGELSEFLNFPGASEKSGPAMRLSEFLRLLRLTFWTNEDKETLWDPLYMSALLAILKLFNKWAHHTEWNRLHAITLIEHCLFESWPDMQTPIFWDRVQLGLDSSVRFPKSVSAADRAALEVQEIGSPTILDYTKPLRDHVEIFEQDKHAWAATLTDVAVTIHKGHTDGIPANFLYNTEVLARSWRVAQIVCEELPDASVACAKANAYQWTLVNLIIKEHVHFPRLEAMAADPNGLFQMLLRYGDEHPVFGPGENRSLRHHLMDEWFTAPTDPNPNAYNRYLNFFKMEDLTPIILKYVRILRGDSLEDRVAILGSTTMNAIVKFLHTDKARLLDSEFQLLQFAFENIAELWHTDVLAISNNVHMQLRASNYRQPPTVPPLQIAPKAAAWFKTKDCQLLLQVAVSKVSYFEVEELKPAAPAKGAAAPAAGTAASAAAPAPASDAPTFRLLSHVRSHPYLYAIIHAIHLMQPALLLSTAGLLLRSRLPQLGKEIMAERTVQADGEDTMMSREPLPKSMADLNGSRYFDLVCDLVALWTPHASAHQPSTPMIDLAFMTLLEYDDASAGVNDRAAAVLCRIVGQFASMRESVMCSSLIGRLVTATVKKAPARFRHLVRAATVLLVDGSASEDVEARSTFFEALRASMPPAAELVHLVQQLYADVSAATSLADDATLGRVVGIALLALHVKATYLRERAAYDAGTSQVDSGYDAVLTEFHTLHQSLPQVFTTLLSAFVAHPVDAAVDPDLVEFQARVQADLLSAPLPTPTPRPPRAVAPAVEAADEAMAEDVINIAPAEPAASAAASAAPEAPEAPTAEVAPDSDVAMVDAPSAAGATPAPPAAESVAPAQQPPQANE